MKSKLEFMISVEKQSKWYFNLWDLVNIWGFKILKWRWCCCWCFTWTRGRRRSWPPSLLVDRGPLTFFRPICWFLLRPLFQIRIPPFFLFLFCIFLYYFSSFYLFIFVIFSLLRISKNMQNYIIFFLFLFSFIYFI